MSPKLLTFVGQDACTVGLAANRQPEVMIGDPPVWRASYGMPQANRMMRLDPQLVRLVAPVRNLVEDIARTTVPVDADVAAFIDDLLATTNDPSRPQVAEALTLVRSHLT